jgi:hypothetical protein
MKCLLCHKGISRLRSWKTKSEFCSDEHADTYKKQTLERLLRDQEQLLDKVSAPPLPIAGDASDDGLDTILAESMEAGGLDRSHLLAAAEPASPAPDAFGDELPSTPAASLDDILSGGKPAGLDAVRDELSDSTAAGFDEIFSSSQPAGLDDDDGVGQQTPDEALAALHRLSEHPAVESPLIVPDAAPDAEGARGADQDELLGPLERLAASRNIDAQQLLDEVVTGSDASPDSEPDQTREGKPDQTSADFEFGGSGTVGKQQSSSGMSSMLDRLTDAGRPAEPSQALQMPGIGERLELDGTVSPAEPWESESVTGEADSAAEAHVADSGAPPSDADATTESSIPLWLREFETETGGTEDPAVRELSGELSREADRDQERFYTTRAEQEPPESLNSDSLAPGSKEEKEQSEHENQASARTKNTPNAADWMSKLLQGGASEATHPDSERKTPDPPDQTGLEEDAKLPEIAASEATQPADELLPADALEPGDLNVDWVASAEESPAIAGEDQETLDSLLDGLMATSEDHEALQESDSSVASGEAGAAPSAKNVVRFPGSVELTRFKTASARNPVENEPAETAATSAGATSALDTEQQWTPWLEMMEIELSAQELTQSPDPGQELEAAEVIAAHPAPRFWPAAIGPVSHAGLSIRDAIWAQDAEICEKVDAPSEAYELDSTPAQVETIVGVDLGDRDGAIGTVRRADRIPLSEELIRFTLRPSDNVRDGFLDHQADLLPGGIGKLVNLPHDGAGATLLGADAASYRARPELQPISPTARLAIVDGLFVVEPTLAESVGKDRLHQQAELAVPILELQSPNRIAARTPLKPIASIGRLEIFEGLWLPAPQLVDLPEQTADRMHGDLIPSKVECQLSSLADTRYGVAVNVCHMTPNRLLRCFWPAWAEPLQKPVVHEVGDSSIEPRLEPLMPEAVYHRVRRGRTTFPRVENVLTATAADKRAMMARQPDVDWAELVDLDNLVDLGNLQAPLAHSGMTVADFGEEVQDWRAEPIGPLLALHGPENLDPCEYA